MGIFFLLSGKKKKMIKAKHKSNYQFVKEFIGPARRSNGDSGKKTKAGPCLSF